MTKDISCNCRVVNGVHYTVVGNTLEWTDEEIRLEQLASKLKEEGKL